jgi:hypothetical protein
VTSTTDLRITVPAGVTRAAGAIDAKTDSGDVEIHAR